MSGEPDPSEPLQVHIDWWVEAGWEVTSQADDKATLRKEIQLSEWHSETEYCDLYVKDGLVNRASS
jgi:hypothetical protein